MCSYIFYGSSSIYGGPPVVISKSKTPNDHKSADLLCPLFKIISGAIYSGVPIKVDALSFESFNYLESK